MLKRSFVGGILAAAAIALLLGGQSALATHEPANKVSAAGASIDTIGLGADVVLLSEKVKTSKPTDLILGVTLECAITTELTTMGNETETANAMVRIWVTIDGQPVPVSTDDTNTPGKVVFCNRMDQRETTFFDDADATIRTFLQERAANGFNWMALDVGSATHTIEVHGELTASASSVDSSAMAAVGKRTLIIEPVKSANDEAITQLG